MLGSLDMLELGCFHSKVATYQLSSVEVDSSQVGFGRVIARARLACIQAC